jgi:c-di-GMP-binding flagellar brake protein YcgR
MEDKRQKPRFNIDQMIEYSLDGERHFKAQITNISESGLSVMTEIEPEAQAPVSIILGLDTDEDHQQIPVEGITVWVTRKPKGFVSGIQFMDLQDEQRRIIVDFIHRCKIHK